MLVDREVTATVKANGAVKMLSSTWDMESVGGVVRDTDYRRHKYYAAGPVFLDTYLQPNGRASVWVPDEQNTLLVLPDPAQVSWSSSSPW